MERGKALRPKNSTAGRLTSAGPPDRMGEKEGNGRYEIEKERFGTFLNELRRERGMTQKELSQHLYVSDKAVSKWERGVSHS